MFVIFLFQPILYKVVRLNVKYLALSSPYVLPQLILFCCDSLPFTAFQGALIGWSLIHGKNVFTPETKQIMG